MFSSLSDKEEKNHIRNLSPQAFENYIAELFKEKGFNVQVTPPTNDGGKDIVMSLNGRKYFVECKHYSDGAIGREIIQKLLGAGTLEGDVVGYFVVTSSYFNKNAIECGEKLNNLVLLDLDDVIFLKKTPANIFQSNINNHFCGTLKQQTEPKLIKPYIIITNGLNNTYVDVVKQTLGKELSVKYYFTELSSYRILKNDYHSISINATVDKISTHYCIRVSRKNKPPFIVRFAHIRNSTNRHLIEFTEFLQQIKQEILDNRYYIK